MTAATTVNESSDSIHQTVIQRDTSDPANLRQWLQQHGSKKLVLLFDTFLHELRIHAAINIDVAQNLTDCSRFKLVHKTLNLIRHMIGSTSWKTPAEVLYMIRSIGSEIVRTTGTNQQDPAVENIIRRVIASIREEAVREDQDASAKTAALDGAGSMNTSTGDGGRLSLQSILWSSPPPLQKAGRGSSRSGSTVAQRQESLASEEEMKSSLQATSITSPYCYSFPTSYYTARPNFKVTVLEAVQEILTDLEDMHRNINDQVLNYIHAGEIILTCGNSETVELFLKAAYNKIKQQQQSSPNTVPFTVIVCGEGSDMACNLAKTGITTTCIETAAVFAIMARVNKVLLPVHAVLANGGLVTQSGGNLVALAAHEKSVPVVCVSGLYKLCPMFPHEGQDTLQELLCPVPTLVPNFNELHTVFDAVELVNPSRDYIEPKLISLYITNVGSFPPSFVYRLLAENYHIDDWKSF
jgi:translation initiation factor eIF-2B subunit beta